MFRDVRLRVRGMIRRVLRLAPMRLVPLGYLSYVLLGWGVLMLPLCAATDRASALDHLFISASAVSTTGLTTVSTRDDYTFVGQAVILVLIQLGGLGYMTASSFFVLSVSGRLSPERERVAATALSLPPGFDVRAFLKLIVAFTLLVEAAGAAALLPVFQRHAAPDPAWQAVFHSVSAFCTAGFGLSNDSFESYRSDGWLNAIIMALSYLGAIGFIVVNDVWQSLRQRKATLTLTSKIILAGTFWVSVVGTVLFALDEPAVRGLPVGERWLTSWFQVMSASTTVGFNTIPIGGNSAASVYLLTIVMIIGASPAGTGGGLKTTTFSAMWAEMMSVIRGRERTTFFGREIPPVRLRAAAANVMLYGAALALGIYGLSLVETAPLPDQMFECASALGTVGLSRGITASLTPAGKGILIALMIIGRIGPLAVGAAMFHAPAVSELDAAPEDVTI